MTWTLVLPLALGLLWTSGTAQAAKPRHDAKPARHASQRAPTGRVDIELHAADLQNTLRLFAAVGQVNIVFGDEVRGTVTIRLRNVHWYTALRAVVAQKGLELEQRGNIFYVARAEAFAAARQRALTAREQCLQSAPLVTRRYRLSYANAEDVARVVRAQLTRRGSVTVDRRTNTLIVSDVRCDNVR